MGNCFYFPGMCIQNAFKDYGDNLLVINKM